MRIKKVADKPVVMGVQPQRQRRHRDLMKPERLSSLMSYSQETLSFTVLQTTEDIRTSAMWQYMSEMVSWFR